MKNLLMLILIIPITLFSQYTYNYLNVQHPQQAWRHGQGSIDQAVLSIRPKGNYVQYDMYLTFSAKDLSFSSSDSIEVQMEFALPKDAIVNDLWLWIDDNTIMKGLILDRWTASSIYENIVKRRRDPALLMKNSDLQYSLRIYPMVGTGYRKVKISYLLPVNFSGKSVTSALPTNILKLSKRSLTKGTVFYWPSSEFNNPSFTEFQNGFESTPRLDNLTGKQYYYGEIPASAINGNVTLSADTKNNKIFVGKYENSLKTGEGYFQVSFNPINLFNISNEQKFVFLYEFDESRSSYSTLSLINSMKSFMLSNMTSKDSFNLIFSGTQIKRMKQSGWIVGDSTSIINTFNLITQNIIQNSANLQALITDGIDFIRNNGNIGTIWLIAGSDKYNHHTIVNPAIQSISEILKPVIPIHITDVSNWSVTSSYFNGKYYYGNDYFYENLSRLTGGTFTAYRQNSSLQTNLQIVHDQIRGTLKSFDMITRIENGFCSNRYSNIPTSSTEVSIDKTITQIGKYNGQFPFVLDVAGLFQGKTISTKITIPDSNVTIMDNTLESIWAGNYIAALESQPQNNSNTKTIIDASLSFRVLSKYSAFLALEPSDTLKACLTCRDESKLVYVADGNDPLIPTNDSMLVAYPNPFNPQTTLKVRLPKGITADQSKLHIFNLLGQLVKTFDISNATAGKYTDITWQGMSDDGKKVSSGVYFAVLITPTKYYSIKLLLTK
ncbi:MAG: VIT domain-containing protein [Bacteroidota bacterium]